MILQKLQPLNLNFQVKYVVQYGEANFAVARKYAFTKKSTIFTQSLRNLA